MELTQARVIYELRASCLRQTIIFIGANTGRGFETAEQTEQTRIPRRQDGLL